MIEITYQLNYLATPISTPISSRKIDTPGRGVTVRPNALHGPRTHVHLEGRVGLTSLWGQRLGIFLLKSSHTSSAAKSSLSVPHACVIPSIRLPLDSQGTPFRSNSVNSLQIQIKNKSHLTILFFHL